MGLLDGVFPKLAKSLIGTFGATAKIERTSQGSYNALSGQTVNRQTSTVTVKITPPEQYSIQEISASLNAFQGSQVPILRTDFKCQVAALSLSLFGAPSTVTDFLQVAGTRYRIVGVNPVYSGDSVAAYELQLRNA